MHPERDKRRRRARDPSVRRLAAASIRSTMTSTASPVIPLALVMGGSRGFGLLLARELGRRGHRLVISARDAEALERAAADLTSAGYDVTTETCDVTDRDQVDDLVRRVEEAQGPIEVMICVAGIIQVGPLEALTREHFTSAIDTMLWGPINTSLAVVPGMRERKRGRIGLITSVGGLVSVPHLLPYCSAKFGAVGFSRGLRAELAGSGVSVTTVAPGLMRTGSHLRAQFVGNHSAEFAWFSAGASLPFVSIDAERAAAQVVSGILVGRAMVVTTPLARIGWRIDALFPTLTSAVFGVAAQLLPQSSATAETVEGWEAAERMSPSGRRVSDAITTLGRRAADRFNEHRR
jgi:NAD(P)-dependent dehydrogenase (short-subunit alcohol dehydrogenase family)